MTPRVPLRSLQARLVAAFLVIGLAPAVVVGWLAVDQARQTLVDAAGERMQVAAANAGDTIDRNLFERYGDVQAFAANSKARGTAAEATDIADFFTRTYTIYDLMLVVDLDGRIRAANTVDHTGSPLPTAALVGTDVSDQPWFKTVVGGGTPEGGSLYSSAERSPLVDAAYGDDRITLPFTAPIFDPDGTMVGVWHNDASFDRIVGEIMAGTRDDLLRSGVDSVQTVLVDADGLVLASSEGGNPLRDNLIDAGRRAAARAVEPDAAGYLPARDARGTTVLDGYAQANGALGFAGYGWGVVVSQDRAAAAAGADGLRNVVLAVTVAGAAVIMLVAVWLARSVSSPIRRVAERARKAAAELAEVAGTMSQSAERTSERAMSTSTVGAEVSSSVSTVAAATVELDASFRHVAEVAVEASSIATEAVDAARVSSSSVSRLGDSSGEIGEVIGVIRSVAQQTNLLALNATIEAARAGEAGRGFAVVANEVKELAQRTAQATEAISEQIDTIRSDAVNVVDANSRISETIDRIQEISGTIASAVEEQTVATAEISRSVSHAADGTGDIARSMADVAVAAGETRDAVVVTMASAAEISTMADDLLAVVSGRA